MISLVLDFLIGRGTLYTVYKLSQNGSVKFLPIGVLLYDADKRFNLEAELSAAVCTDDCVFKKIGQRSADFLS